MVDKKVAFLLPEFGGGGAEPMMVRLANEFARRGYSVDMVVFRARGPNRALVSPEVRVVELMAKRTLLAPFHLRAYIARTRPDVLISALFHVNVTALAARLLVPFSGTKVIITERSPLSAHARNSRRKSRHFFLPVARLFYPLADRIIGVSKGVADDLIACLGLSEHRVGFIYNPSYSSDMMTLQQEPSGIDWLKNSADPLVVTVGRLEPAKDHETLLRAFRDLLAKRPARLLIVGEGRLRPRLEETIRELKLADRVHLAGYVGNPLPMMRAADLFVLTSRWEGFPNVLIEALSCGTRIVATDCVAGPAEILDNGAFGTLVPVGDVEALAGAMKDALETKPDEDRQVRRARTFSVERSTDEFERLVGHLTHEAKPLDASRTA